MNLYIHTQVDAVLGGRPVGYDDMMRLEKTRLALTEALRLYPQVCEPGSPFASLSLSLSLSLFLSLSRSFLHHRQSKREHHESTADDCTVDPAQTPTRAPT